MLTEHPDEGTIHAWLDGELGPMKSSELEAHIGGCAACQAAVAEARGLIAGATRVVGALEPEMRVTPSAAEAGRDMPWGVLSAPTPTGSSIWRALRVTPARAAIAATLLVVAGITLTHDRVARESTMSPGRGDAGGSFAASPATAASAGAHDPLLDSAIARNIAKAIPPRTLERAEGSSVPVAPPSPLSATVVDAAAPMQVAAARRNLRVRADTAAAVADNVAIRGTSSRSGVVAGGAAVAAVAAASMAARPADVNISSLLGQCLRVESASAGARWGMAPLPLTVVLGGTEVDHGTARIATEGSTGSAMMASWKRQPEDSIYLVMRRVGYTGTIQLAAAGELRGGVMRSAPSARVLNEIVEPGATSTQGQPAPRPQATREMRARTVAPAGDGPGGIPVEVVARRVQCP